MCDPETLFENYSKKQHREKLSHFGKSLPRIFIYCYIYLLTFFGHPHIDSRRHPKRSNSYRQS